MYELEQHKVNKVMSFLDKQPIYRTIKSDEGFEVIAFNKDVGEKFIEPKLTKEKLEEMFAFLLEKNTLNIKVGDHGYVSAALREVEDGDETNYDAVWVRDSVWIYEGLKALGRESDAKKVVLGLWDYYSTQSQRKRMRDIISDPTLASEAMNCPHIRFDAASISLDDVFVEKNGKMQPQEWNHKQNDAHGMFLLALSDALNTFQLSSDEITGERAESFALLFQFFKATDYTSFEESGAWEEIDAVRASSVGLVANAHYKWHENFNASKPFILELKSHINALPEEHINSLTDLYAGYEKGLSLVKKHLEAGGESPFYEKTSSLYRGADSALLHLLTPYKLEGLNSNEVKKVIELVNKLERPAGILRYEEDSYQAMGYVWLKDGQLLHGTSDENFKARAKLFDQFGKETEPHWFFDSMLACAYLDLAENENSETAKSEYIQKAIRAVKRNLGQITGSYTDEKPITADGETVSPYLLPESINVILKNGEHRYVTSIIVPLNWPMSSLSLSLKKLQKFL